MRLTALVSGGKDSIFAARLCECHGWDVPELLTLIPAEVDSLLYHTPNLKVVPLIAEAWGKRHVSYPVDGVGEARELSALQDALSGAKGRGAEGVIVGAIRSGYQWARVWSRARSVGLEVFAPLWRASEEAVMLGEIAMGLDARIASVASDTLTEDMLGQPLNFAMLGKLQRLASGPRGLNISGEGGEYETLVLGAPFLQGRISVEESHIVRRGAQATWVIDRARVVY